MTIYKWIWTIYLFLSVLVYFLAGVGVITPKTFIDILGWMMLVASSVSMCLLYLPETKKDK